MFLKKQKLSSVLWSQIKMIGDDELMRAAEICADIGKAKIIRVTELEGFFHHEAGIKHH